MTRAASALILACGLLATTAPGASAATTRELTPDRIHEYSGLTSSKAIQAFDMVGSKDVYYIQRNGNDTLLSRCVRTGGTCAQQEQVKLVGYGHGESLEVWTEGSRILALVGSRAQANDSGVWSTRITLIEYTKKTSGEAASAKALGSLSGLKAVRSSESGDSVRAAVALADGADRLAIRSQNGATGGSSYYGVYKASTVLNKLKGLKGGTVNVSTLSGAKVSSFKEPGRPHGSFQGIDITGVGSGNKYLYVFGGGGGTEKPTIYRFLYTNGGDASQDRTYVYKGATVGVSEAEGVKVEADPSAGGKVRVITGLKNPSKPYRLYHFAE